MSLFRKKSLEHIVAEAASGNSDGHSSGKLNKVLGVRDLTFMGIAAVIGAGIFSTIGTAAYNGGPGISLLFIITAVTCGFSALCYAEFASRVPISGSAYTYAYVSFGELIAWIIGWALILEYAIGNIVVAISWSGYFDNLLRGLGIHLPNWLLTDRFSVNKLIEEAATATQAGQTLTAAQQQAQLTFNTAPVLGGIRLIINLPAFIIVAIITLLAYVGIKESKKTTNLMVVFKIIVIILIIIVGAFYVKPTNWTPFLPEGFGGVLAGVSAVFYAYIGFDAISTTAEECKNPQKDLPRGMIYSLIICTILYILIALILTGMVHYKELKVNDPLAYVFDKLNLDWIGYIISISAVIATTSVLLVFQLGQPRIWMAMSRDGLLPKKFAKVHPNFQTPSFATIATGILVGIPSLFLPSSLMTDLTSIGTLFAFVIVCFGVLLLPKLSEGTVKEKGRFYLPYINGRFIIPVVVTLFVYFFRQRILESAENLFSEGYQEVLFLIFVIISLLVAVFSFLKQWSLIPILGALCCLYLLIEIPAISWFWFFVWMTVGLTIYFFYGRRNSRLNT
ncbi:MAG: amino acid permease [Chitinophagaceae bacterium]